MGWGLGVGVEVGVGVGVRNRSHQHVALPMPRTPVRGVCRRCRSCGTRAPPCWWVPPAHQARWEGACVLCVNGYIRGEGGTMERRYSGGQQQQQLVSAQRRRGATLGATTAAVEHVDT